MNTITAIEESYKKKNIPQFRPGDQLRVYVKVIEGESERVQPFEGTVIRLRGSGLGKSFTVRKISYGVGVERTFPIHSPRVEKIELLRSGKVRRARIYYLRKLTGKASRIEEDTDKTTSDKAAKQVPEPAVTAEVKKPAS
jgi:large subunit ribosomal protein L19